MLDSLVRVSRRAVGNHFVSITLTLSHLQESLILIQNIACNKSHHYKWQANLIGCQATSIDSTTGNQCYNNGRSKYLFTKTVSCQSMLTCQGIQVLQSNTSFIHFPFKVQVLLTLFSKFFSSFLHSTCSLSVSRLYLAFGWNLPPIRTAVSSNPTRWMHHRSRAKP